MEARDEILKKLEKINNLPTIPLVVTMLNEAIKNPRTSARDIARILEDDPAIMTRILKFVNSSYYASLTGREITSLQQAIARLGFSVLKNIALTTSVFTLFKNTKNQMFDLREFWKHCISTGFACSVLNKYSNSPEGKKEIAYDVVHLAGLLHDIGKIILQEYFHSEFVKVLEYSQKEKIPLYQSEQKLFNIDHSEIGGWLAEKWNLNPEIIAIIKYHHCPTSTDSEYKTLISLVHISDYICNYKGIGYSGNSVSPVYSSKVWKYLNLSISDIPKIVEEVENDSKNSEILLSMM